MRSIIRWQPFTELMNLRQAMDGLFDYGFITPSRFFSTFASDMATPVDMYHTADDVVVKAALPGMKPEEVDITITDGTLAIKGETKGEEEVKKEDYLYREHRYGTFSRLVNLPAGLNTDKATATFDDGILTLTIPKTRKAKPKEIKVKTKAKAKAKSATKGKK
jgi:HSP20 family protein